MGRLPDGRAHRSREAEKEEHQREALDLLSVVPDGQADVIRSRNHETTAKLTTRVPTKQGGEEGKN